MRRVVVAIAAFAALSGGLAAAREDGGFAPAPEVRAALFGKDLRGIYKDSGAPWRECITRQGVTRFWFSGVVEDGRLEVTGEGRACFSYQSSGYQVPACWRVRFERAGRVSFFDDDGREAFVAMESRPAGNCRGSEPVPMS